MDFEKCLIDKVTQTGNIDFLLSSGIRENHFTKEENKKIFSFMVDHFRKYKVSPSLETMRTEFKDHLFELNTESLEYLTDKFLTQVKRVYAMTAIRELAEIVDDDKLAPDIDSLFLEKSRELATIIPKSTFSKFSDMERRIQEYETGINYSNNIEMGIPVFDFITSGIQPHEYVTIAGASGIGKSTLAQWILFNAWMQGKTPMYISLEMEAKALFRKWDTMLMNFEYNRLKRQTLREKDLERWKKKAEEISNLKNDIIVMDNVNGATVDRIYAELVRFRPDILCIDYISLMDTNRSAGSQLWEKIMYLTQQLKQTSRTLNIPIIGVAQTNRSGYQDGARIDNIAFSNSIVQDSDIVLGLHADEEMREQHRMEVRLIKNRDGETTNADLLWNMKTMEFAPWKEAYAFIDSPNKIDGEV